MANDDFLAAKEQLSELRAELSELATSLKMARVLSSDWEKRVNVIRRFLSGPGSFSTPVTDPNTRLSALSLIEHVRTSGKVEVTWHKEEPNSFCELDRVLE